MPNQVLWISTSLTYLVSVHFSRSPKLFPGSDPLHLLDYCSTHLLFLFLVLLFAKLFTCSQSYISKICIWHVISLLKVFSSSLLPSDKSQMIYCITLQDLVPVYPTSHPTMNFLLSRPNELAICSFLTTMLSLPSFTKIPHWILKYHTDHPNLRQQKIFILY